MLRGGDQSRQEPEIRLDLDHPPGVRWSPKAEMNCSACLAFTNFCYSVMLDNTWDVIFCIFCYLCFHRCSIYQLNIIICVLFV